MLPLLSKSQKDEIDAWYKNYGLVLNDYYFHRWYYEVTGIFSPSCVPECVMNHQILNQFNNSRLSLAWADKAYYDSRFRFKCIGTPHTLVRNINGIFYDNSYNRIDIHEAFKLIEKEETLIAKPTLDSGKGKNIRLYTLKQEFLLIFDDYSSDYLIQKKVEQHDAFSKFNKSSVNTFRVMSWFDGVDVYILLAILRVGMPGSVVDNISGGGFAFCVKENGSISGPGLNLAGRIVEGTEKMISDPNVLIQFYQKAVRSIKKLHPQLPYFGLIAWDIAIDKDGAPVLIEYNLRNPAFHIIQALCGTFENGIYKKLLLEAKRRREYAGTNYYKG
ncbi:MAG: sugar-transfer associated ATP-grasp domain-containing protein [Synergistaceae bacterium]|nr:sugar-transfer associated ATP-grasp domain-containing protein [Synergistaceae bacterium]